MVAGALARREHSPGPAISNFDHPRAGASPDSQPLPALGWGDVQGPQTLGGLPLGPVSGPSSHSPQWASLTVISPLELVRTKLQAQHLSYGELGTCVRAAVAQGGWRSLWLGLGSHCPARDVPFSGRHLECRG